MLLRDYTYYFFSILAAALQTPVGLLGIAAFVAAILALFVLRGQPKLRVRAFWAALLLSIFCVSTSFYAGIYEFDERPDMVTFDSLPAGEPTCGTAWSNWIKSGYGLNNNCPEGCYRGKVLRKQMRMRGIPPWPEYRRKLQCWQR